jgi:hypothetical protein
LFSIFIRSLFLALLIIAQFDSKKARGSTVFAIKSSLQYHLFTKFIAQALASLQFVLLG